MHLLPFAFFLEASMDLNQTTGMGHTSCIGNGSIKQADFLFQAAPSRNSERM